MIVIIVSRHVPAILLQVVSRPAQIELFVRSTFFAHTSEPAQVLTAVKAALSSMRKQHVLEWNAASMSYLPSAVGLAIASCGLAPDEALWMIEELAQARRAFCFDCELHVCYLVTPLQTAVATDWRRFASMFGSFDSPVSRVAEYIGITERFVARAVLYPFAYPLAHTHTRGLWLAVGMPGGTATGTGDSTQEDVR